VLDLVNVQNVSLVLFFVGLYGVLSNRNIIKSIIAVNIMDVAAILFLITVNTRPEQVPPIGAEDFAMMADPLPQALMITAIVIGISVTAVSITVFIGLFRKHGTADWQKIINRIAQG
jgi:multicomponent Na+:H+ antiporter subunit C